MSLRRSARQTTTLLAKTNETSPSLLSGTRKRTDGEEESLLAQPKRVKKALPRDASSTETATFKVPPVPTTPVRKRSAKATQPPHLTPTPSLIGLMRSSYSSGDIDDATPPPSKSNTESCCPLNPVVFIVPVLLNHHPLRLHLVYRTYFRPQKSPLDCLMAHSSSPSAQRGYTDNCSPDDRPVEPHTTNATLVTPDGTQATTYPSNGWPDSSPSKTGLPRPTGTTGTILDQACAHLVSVDPKMKPLVEKHRCEIFSAKGLAEEIDPFRSLTTGIMGQQVSGAAAKSIKNKFIALFNEANPDNLVFPTPAQVAKTDITRLRLAGLSQRKAEYIQGLAEKFTSGELSTTMLMKASDEEVMERLIAVRGLGRWSCEMFACFGLKRMDVFSTGDLGVQRGMAAYMGKDVSKLKAKGGGKWKYMSELDMLEHSAKFAPYRSLFMWYMWRVEDVDISVMQNDE